MLHTFKKWSGGVAVIALTAGFIAIDGAPARAATTPLYSGGATFPELAYRDLFNCYGNNSGANLPSLGTPNSGADNPGFRLHSGRFPVQPERRIALCRRRQRQRQEGLRRPRRQPARLRQQNPGRPGRRRKVRRATSGLSSARRPVSSRSREPMIPYPTFHFAGSDDPLAPVRSQQVSWRHVHNDDGVTVDQSVWAAHRSSSRPWSRLPRLPSSPPRAPLSRRARNRRAAAAKCSSPATPGAASSPGRSPTGTMPRSPPTTRAPRITGGVSEPINVIYRSDGSGTTFIFTNALMNQCGSIRPRRGARSRRQPSGSARCLADRATATRYQGSQHPRRSTDPAFQSNNDFFINLDGTHQAAADVTGHYPAGQLPRRERQWRHPKVPRPARQRRRHRLFVAGLHSGLRGDGRQR